MNAPEHRALRDLLGAYALGHLDAAERRTVEAHLDGCAACRAELADLRPLVALLDDVDPEHFETPPHPPADLGARIREAVAAERRARGSERTRFPRSVPRPVRLALAAAAVVIVALGGGVVGRTTAPEPPQPPLEAVALDPASGSGVRVDAANLVAHTWGVELRMQGEGFTAGATFRAAFRDDETGRLTPAGEFIGTGEAPMTCNLQSAVLRDAVTEVVVMDETGDVVLSADL